MKNWLKSSGLDEFIKLPPKGAKSDQLVGAVPDIEQSIDKSSVACLLPREIA